MAAVQQQTTQLEFHQAMADFKTMFPDMDDDVIEAVLRANQGAVDTTIDQLLAMSTDNENERIRKEIEEKDAQKSDDTPLLDLSGDGDASSFAASPLAKKDPASPVALPTSPPGGRGLLPLVTASPQKSSVQQPQQQSPQATSASQSPGAGDASSPTGHALRVVKGWNPPLLGPLPRDFLRIYSPHRKTSRENVVFSHQFLQQKYAENKQKRGALADLNDPELARYLEDERIALFLQNEEFMQELRRNKDFMTSLERDSHHRRPKHWSDSSSEDSEEFDSSGDEQSEALESPPEEVLGAFPYTKNMPSAHDDDALFKEKLRNMGKMSRKKFAQLARVFTRRKKRSAKQILSQGPAPSKDNLLLNAEPILVEEEDEYEEGEEKLDTISPETSGHFQPEDSPPSGTLTSHQVSHGAGTSSKLEGQ